MTKKNAENELVGRSPVRKFSPGMHQSDEEIISQFVVRDHEFKIILEVLHGNIKSSSCQHVLVVAPRGRGKTMLLARIAAELRTKDKFSKHLLPVQFMEESQEIFTLADFWLETLFHLAREITRCNPALAQELRETHVALTKRWQERGIGDHARAAVLAATDQLGTKLVLMVENLQALCESVDEDFGWKLREVLQSEPQIMLLASATSRFESLDDVEQPFFELFRIVNLERLTTEDCRHLWEFISGKETSTREIRPLEILTGGSPRLLIIIAEFARHGSMRQLMEELVALIDEHTEYFRSHLENFPSRERRVYVALIDLWQPSKTSEIAVRARMDIRKVSTMLRRLIERGAVIVEGSDKKRLYVAAERLYSIYYRLRRERDEAAVVKNLVYFMAVFYSESELYEISDNLIAEATQSKAIREGIERAIAERSQIEDEFYNIKWQTIRQISNQALENYRLMNEQFVEEEINTVLKEKDPKKVIEKVNKVLTSQDISSFPIPEAQIASLLNKKISGYEEIGNFKDVITTCNEVIKRFNDTDTPDLQYQVASAMLDKGNALGELGNLEAAITICDEMIERFTDTPDLQQQAAWAMIFKADALGRLGDFEAPITIYDEMIERFTDTPGLQYQVASAMVDKGNALGRLGDFEGAITIYDEVIEGFTDTPDLQYQVAFAMVDKGNTLGELGNLEAAITIYDEVIERFTDTPGLQYQVASAMVDKGNALGRLGDFEAAITIYDEVIERFTDTPGLQHRVAWAMIFKADSLGGLGNFEAVITVCDEMIERFTDTPDLQYQVASAMIRKGAALGELGNFEAVITVCDKVIERFTGTPDLQYQVASAMIRKGAALGELGNFEAVITVCDKVIERFTDTPDLQYQVASAMLDKGNALGELGNLEAVITVCDEMIERFTDTPDLQQQVAWAMIFKADSLGGLGNFEAVITVCDEMIERFTDTPDLQQQVASAMIRKGAALGELGNFEAVITVCDEMIERFTDTPDLQYQVASAMINKAELQIKMHHSEDALHTCKDFERKIDVWNSDKNTELSWRAMCVQALALTVQKKYNDALDMFRLIYDKFVPSNKLMTLTMLSFVQDMIVIGFPVQDLVDILSTNNKKSDALTPLIVALRQYGGESVRAPEEILEVAADILEHIKEKKGGHVAGEA